MSEHSVHAQTYRITESTGYLLRRAHKLSIQLAEAAFVGAELSFVQWIALVHLRDELVDTASGLARALGHDGGATTRMLDQLEERGLIGRERSMTDRRVVRLALTPRGRAVADRLIPRVARIWEDVFDEFTPADVAMLTILLQRLVGRLTAVTGTRPDA